MTWREGVQYWCAWAEVDDPIPTEDMQRIAEFYDAMVQYRPNFDDEMPSELAKRLGMVQ